MIEIGLGMLGVGLGAAGVTVGAAYGIGRLASSALDGMARQPENSGNIRGAAIVLAALIEGFTFFALIVCIIAAYFTYSHGGKTLEAKAPAAQSAIEKSH
jgi:F-type H+-transporting ATPase subunit c